MRETWIQNDIMEDFPTRAIFLFGNTYDDETQKEIVIESDTFGDIIQADFKESYHNLSLKALVGLKWVMTYCNQAKYVIRTNDELVVDVFLMREFLDKKVANKPRTVMGRILGTSRVFRPGNESKFTVAENDHPGEKYFPHYMDGFFTMMSTDMIRDLYGKALETTFAAGEL